MQSELGAIMKKGLIAFGVILAGATAGLGGYYGFGRTVAPPEVTTLEVSRGDIAPSRGTAGGARPTGS
jgi:hypothetical protein